VGGIIGICQRDSREHLLVALTGEHIAIVKRLLAEIGQEGVPRRVDLDPFDDAEIRLRLGFPTAESRLFFSKYGFCGHRNLSLEAKIR
jgi:hypothetical protein